MVDTVKTAQFKAQVTAASGVISIPKNFTVVEAVAVPPPVEAPVVEPAVEATVVESTVEAAVVEAIVEATAKKR